MKAKHIGYYLENSSQDFDDNLNDLLVELDLEDCLNLMRWLNARMQELVEERSIGVEPQSAFSQMEGKGAIRLA